MTKKLPAVHPGEILREDCPAATQCRRSPGFPHALFLVPMALTPYAVAQACAVPRTRIERLKYFGTTPTFWMNLQAQYDLEVAEDATAADIKRIKPAKHSAA